MKKITWEDIGCFVGIIAFIVGIAFLFGYNKNMEEEKKAKAEAFLRQEEEKKEQERKAAEVERRSIGKYLFIDALGTTHLKRNCLEIGRTEYRYGFTEEDEEDITVVGNGVRRILVSELSADDIRKSKLCNECIDDEIYERLIEATSPSTNKTKDTMSIYE